VSRETFHRPRCFRLMPRLGLALALLAATGARAHDVYMDVGLHAARVGSKAEPACGLADPVTECNPRNGNFTTSVSGTVDFSESVSAWAGFAYTRDFATATREAKTDGSNVYLLSAGVAWLVTDHWTTMLNGTFAPAVVMRSATTVSFEDRTADVVVRSVDRSFGLTALASYMSAGLSSFEWALDASVGATRFDTSQSAEVPGTVRGLALRTFCEQHPFARACALVTGAQTSVWQVRLGATFIATLVEHADLGLDAAWFVYDKDPTSIGFFTVAALGQSADLGNGVPVAPYLATAKPSFTWRWERVTLKVSYQFGVYAGALGVNHLVALKGTLHATKKVHLSLTLLGQSDGGGRNVGVAGVLGLLVEF